MLAELPKILAESAIILSEVAKKNHQVLFFGQ
jgi:hypothetical protein